MNILKSIIAGNFLLMALVVMGFADATVGLYIVIALILSLIVWVAYATIKDIKEFIPKRDKT